MMIASTPRSLACSTIASPTLLAGTQLRSTSTDGYSAATSMARSRARFARSSFAAGGGPSSGTVSGSSIT